MFLCYRITLIGFVLRLKSNVIFYFQPLFIFLFIFYLSLSLINWQFKIDLLFLNSIRKKYILIAQNLNSAWLLQIARRRQGTFKWFINKIKKNIACSSWMTIMYSLQVFCVKTHLHSDISILHYNYPLKWNNTPGKSPKN